MERYSRLCETSQNICAPQTLELGRSQNLDVFLRRQGIMNLQACYDIVEQELADFHKLSDFSDLSPENYPMLIRCSTIRLAGRPGWAKDLMPFLALCCSGLDSSGTIRHHTYFFRIDLLQKSGDFNYLDHLFGSHFAVSPLACDADGHPTDLELPPARMEPVSRAADSLLVYSAAATILKGRSVVLKLEKGCDYNRRAMELLSRIYSILPPVLAVQTGFSSYQDPQQIKRLINTTSIRVFLTHADCICGSSNPQYLYFDLNQPIKPQVDAAMNILSVSNSLLKSLSYWDNLPWRERQPLMELLFSEELPPLNEQRYCSITRRFLSDPFIQWIQRMPDRGTVTSLAELKEHYDRFPICNQIPILRETFCKAVPDLLKPPMTLELLSEEVIRQTTDAAIGTTKQDQLEVLSDFAGMLLAISSTRPAPTPQSSPDRAIDIHRNEQDPPLMEKSLNSLQSPAETESENTAQSREAISTERELQSKITQLEHMLEAEKQEYARSYAALKQQYLDKSNHWHSKAAVHIQQLQSELETARTHTADNPAVAELIRAAVDAKQADLVKTYEAKIDLLLHENNVLRDTLSRQPDPETRAAEMEAAVHDARLHAMEHAEALFLRDREQLEQEYKAQIEEIKASSALTLKELAQQHNAQIAILKHELSSVVQERDNALAACKTLEHKHSGDMRKAAETIDLLVSQQAQMKEELLADIRRLDEMLSRISREKAQEEFARQQLEQRYKNTSNESNPGRHNRFFGK